MENQKGKRKGLGLNYLGHLFINEFILDIKFDSSDAAITGIIAEYYTYRKKHFSYISKNARKLKIIKLKYNPCLNRKHD